MNVELAELHAYLEPSDEIAIFADFKLDGELLKKVKILFDFCVIPMTAEVDPQSLSECLGGRTDYDFHELLAAFNRAVDPERVLDFYEETFGTEEDGDPFGPE